MSSNLDDSFYTQRDSGFVGSSMIISEKNAQILDKTASKIDTFFRQQQLNNNLKINGTITCDNIIAKNLNTIDQKTGSLTSDITVNSVINTMNVVDASSGRITYLAATSVNVGSSTSQISLSNGTVAAPNGFIGIQTSNIPNLSASKITSDELDAARIPNLSASKITSDELDAARIPNLSASKITSDELDAARIPNLSASKITNDELDAARIPNLSASKITSDELDAARIPNLSASKITSDELDAARIPNLSASKITSGVVAIERLPIVTIDLTITLQNQLVNNNNCSSSSYVQLMPLNANARTLLNDGFFISPQNGSFTISFTTVPSTAGSYDFRVLIIS